MTPYGGTISDLIAQRDTLKLNKSIIKDLAEAGSIRQERYTRSEVRFCAAVDVKNLQKEFDRLSKQYRELDMKLQELNWTVELL